MSVFLWYLGVYLVIGAGVLVLLNTLTNNGIVHNFGEAALDGQDILLNHGLYVGSEAIKYVMAVMVWVFWPVLVFGKVAKMLRTRTGKEK